MPMGSLSGIPQLPAGPDAWLAAARQHDGSWWGHWRDWLVARSGQPRPAPILLGNPSIRHKPMRPAPTCSATDRYAMTALFNLDVDGQLLRVARRAGRSDMVPLLLINGLGASLELLEPFAQALGDIETIRIDLPGTGGSPASSIPYRPSGLATLLNRSLNCLVARRSMCWASRLVVRLPSSSLGSTRIAFAASFWSAPAQVRSWCQGHHPRCSPC